MQTAYISVCFSTAQLTLPLITRFSLLLHSNASIFNFQINSVARTCAASVEIS